jgi:hypothetical protein
MSDLIYYKTVNNGKNFQYKEKRRICVFPEAVSASKTTAYSDGKRFRIGQFFVD